jgi:hypothetical protein
MFNEWSDAHDVSKCSVLTVCWYGALPGGPPPPPHIFISRNLLFYAFFAQASEDEHKYIRN